MVAATNSNGEPDIYFVIVECTNEQIDRGDHYDAAREAAQAAGYEPHDLVFDQNNAAGNAMQSLFVWESASIVNI